MRKLLGWACVVFWASLGLYAAEKSTAHKKAASKKTTGAASSKNSKAVGGKTTSKSSSGKSVSRKSAGKNSAKAGSKTGKTTASKRGRKSAPKTTWRTRQAAPAPERYKQIQDALVAKGYLNAEDANGQWGQSSVAALKAFQTAQNIESSGKINSLSLIALGLGPKREAVAPPKPSDPVAPKPPEAQPTQP